MTLRASFPLLVLALSLCLHSTLLADSTRYDYSISFDKNGQLSNGTWNSPHIAETIVTSGGDGWGWYYYPASDRYIMWFPSGPYSTDHKADMTFFLFVASALEASTCDYDVSIGWTTPNWTNPNSPPMPGDMSSQAQENLYLYTNSIVGVTNNPLGADNTYEISLTLTNETYNPEWICVCASGRNVWMWRFLSHESVPQDDDPVVPPLTSWDYGDASASYGVLLADNGPRHALGQLRLGQNVSAEGDGRPSVSADLDTYDDGVLFTTALQPDQPATVLVTSTGSGYVNAWLDLNRDGHWTSPNEQIFVNEPVLAGPNPLNFYLDASAQAGSSFVRFRLSRNLGLTPYGSAPDGEVEDYAVTILPDQAWDPNGPVNPQYLLTGAWGQGPQWRSPRDPLLSGWGQESLWNSGPLVADDWIYQSAEPIVGLRWWGTFKGWMADRIPNELPTSFHFGIWTNLAGTDMPETLIWQSTTDKWTWNYTGQVEDPYTQQDGQSVFEFTCTLDQDRWFSLPATTETRYWLSIAAIYPGAPPSQTTWAWLTRQPQEQQPAQRINRLQALNGNNEVPFPPSLSVRAMQVDPVADPTQQPWDMAFELLTRRP